MSAERSLTWRDDARDELIRVWVALYAGRLGRAWRRRFVWQIEALLLAWTVKAEPCIDYEARLLAESEDGDWLVPAGRRNGEPWWEGYWRWWRPDHWPVYVRSLRRRSYVMVESGDAS